MAKIMREQAVKERRARKQEKKLERKQAAAELGATPEETPPGQAAEGDTPKD